MRPANQDRSPFFIERKRTITKSKRLAQQEKAKMPQAKNQNSDVWYVEESVSVEKVKVPPSEIDGLVSGFLKIKSQKVRREVMALITELTREDRKL